MDDDMLLLIHQSVVATRRALRRGDVAEAERWTRIADRTATILAKLQKVRGAPKAIRP